MRIFTILVCIYQGVKHCEDRNASIIEILGGVRAEDKRFDISEQFHHVWWMGASLSNWCHLFAFEFLCGCIAGDMNYRLTYDKKTPGNSKKNLPNAAPKRSGLDSADVQLQVAGTKSTSGDIMDDSDSDGESDEDGEVPLKGAEGGSSESSQNPDKKAQKHQLR